jgi:hypothetical protein
MKDEEPMSPRAQAVIAKLARQKQMPMARSARDSFSRLLETITTAPQDRPDAPAKGSTPQIITEADFARVIAERNAARP